MTLAQRVATPRGLRRRLHLIGVLPGLCALLVLLGAGPVVVQSVYGRAVWGGATVVCGFVCVLAWRMSGSTAAAVYAAETTRQQRDADHVARLRAGLPTALKEIQVLVDQVRRGEQPQVRTVHHEEPDGDPLVLLAGDLNNFVREVQLYVATSSADRVRDALLVLGRRMLSLTTAAISDFDRLEETIEDPDILGPLFRLDHKVTRVRRFAESLVIVGGGAPRESRKPDELSLVIRHAMQEVEQYARVSVVAPVDTLVRGRVTVGLVHLLAELIDNAANFSPPDQPVTVRVSQVPAGFAIEVEDRGSPIPAVTMQHLNQLLADPASRYTGEYVRDGRLGLWVVSLLANRFGVGVRLQTNAYGANTAVVVLPAEQLHAGDEPWGARPPSGLTPVRQPHQPGAGVREPLAETTLALSAVKYLARHPVAPRQPVPGRGAEPAAPLPRRTPARAGQSSGSRAGPAGGQPRGAGNDRPPLARRDTSKNYSHPGLRTEQEGGESSRTAPDPGLARAFLAGGRAPAERDVDGDAARPGPTDNPHVEDNHAE
ncbi:sensor histidine kinase [Streptomyces echinatus]|uniref:sensor histidine kinase n=1 Tax=Streptomyces echinatus TaxID=67293 RepID=UPI0037B3C462